MAAPANPFEQSPVSASDWAPAPEDQISPEFRTPAFRAPRRQDDDLEREPLEMDEHSIIQLLGQYFDEAENARETGYEPRHLVWEDNLNAFWMRRDYPDKQDWQSREKSAAVPNFVERFAAQLRESLTYSPDWLDIKDRSDPTGELSRFATRLARRALDFSGTNSSGHPVPFEHEFGNIVMTGALMMMCCSVTWDPRLGRTVTEQVDPRQVYRDPTGRGLYRVRFYEADKETLLRMAELTDSEGNPLYDEEAIEELAANRSQDQIENRETSSGTGQMLTSPRTPILIKEWLVDLIYDTEDGRRIVREKQLIVTANDTRIIRGPEPNPYWHGKDWIVMHPVLQAPMKAIDGRTYVEIFRHAADTNENVLNRILDIASSNMNAFEVNPDLIDDPDRLMRGIAPNMTIMRSEDAPEGAQAIRVLEMGRPISADMMSLYRETRRTMQEDGAQSDISLGQQSRGETTATEVVESRAGQSSLTNSISIDIDMGFLGPVGELVYYCTLQHVDERSLGIWTALTEEDRLMLERARAEFKARPIWVRASGLTNAVQRSRRLRGLLGALNVVGGNQLLVAEFTKEYSMSKLLKLIFEDFGVPIDELRLSAEQKFMQDEKRRQVEAAALTQSQLGPPPAGGLPGGGPPTDGGGGAGAPAQLAQALGGANPLQAGVVEGLPGEVR